MEKKQIGKELKKKTAQEQMRVVRGYAIISKGDTPKKIGKETYTVPSQAGNGNYTITNNGSWKCTCPDFENKNLLSDKTREMKGYSILAISYISNYHYFLCHFKS